VDEIQTRRYETSSYASIYQQLIFDKPSLEDIFAVFILAVVAITHSNFKRYLLLFSYISLLLDAGQLVEKFFELNLF